MAFLPAKPASNRRPRWNVDMTNNTEPTTFKKDAGWVVGEEPSSAFFNWWQNSVFRWQEWSENAIDELNLQKLDSFMRINTHVPFMNFLHSNEEPNRLPNSPPLIMWNEAPTADGTVYIAYDMIVGEDPTFGFRSSVIKLHSESVSRHETRVMSSQGHNVLMNTILGHISNVNPANSSHYFYTTMQFMSPVNMYSALTTMAPVTVQASMTQTGVNEFRSDRIFPRTTTGRIGTTSSGNAFDWGYIKRLRTMNTLNYGYLQEPTTVFEMMSEWQNKSIVLMFGNIGSGNIPILKESTLFNVRTTGANATRRVNAGVWVIVPTINIHAQSLVLVTCNTLDRRATAWIYSEGGVNQIGVSIINTANNLPDDSEFSLIVYGLPSSGPLTPPASLA
jgi:hypothetical protein